MGQPFAQRDDGELGVVVRATQWFWHDLVDHAQFMKVLGRQFQRFGGVLVGGGTYGAA